MNNDALLSVRDLGLEFVTRHGSVRALENVSFDLKRGEILGVVGESGAGKSLTGRAIIGLIDAPGRIAAGEIVFEGRRIDGLRPNEMRPLRGRRIATIFQDPLTSLDPLQTIGDQLTETIRTHLPLSRSKARQRALALLGEVGIPAPIERIDAWPHEFSGGMRQRVVIALALAGRPDLVIADEPTTALDVSVQAQIIALIKRLRQRQSMSVMLITHDMGVIAAAADRVVVMYSGRVVETGPVREVISRPWHPYTKGLIGAIPSLEGRVARLNQIPGFMPHPGERPAGCAFSLRCPKAIARCHVEVPLPTRQGARTATCFVEGAPP